MFSSHVDATVLHESRPPLKATVDWDFYISKGDCWLWGCKVRFDSRLFVQIELGLSVDQGHYVIVSPLFLLIVIWSLWLCPEVSGSATCIWVIKLCWMLLCLLCSFESEDRKQSARKWVRQNAEDVIPSATKCCGQGESSHLSLCSLPSSGFIVLFDPLRESPSSTLC